MKFNMKRDFSEKGFTLVELAVTTLILGILVGIVVMTMAFTSSRAEQAACKTNLRMIFDAVNQYCCLHEGEFPENLDILTEEGYLKSSFDWQCPSGDVGTVPGDYRNYYDNITGNTSCPRLNHNP